MTETPRSNRLHIGLYGKCNSGKSSIINRITNQEIAVVSQQRGTTTDPVLKSMELLPLGPIVIIDTGGIDDDTELGKLRVEKSELMLNKTDIAVYVVDGTLGLDEVDKAFIDKIKKRKIPFLVVINKSDIAEKSEESNKFDGILTISVSSKTGAGIDLLKEKLGQLAADNPKDNSPIISDLITKDSVILLVMPVDISAPKGRIILPQQQTIREILDVGATAIVITENEIEKKLAVLKNPPDLIVTDSKVFDLVNPHVPSGVPLTSFSILFARHKGILKDSLFGVAAVENLRAGDKVLISEGCTHHRQCDDIGRVRIPRLLEKHLAEKLDGGKLEYEFSSGGGFPADLSQFKLVIHCGACMLNDTEVKSRMKEANTQKIPMTNYGLFIAYVNGILKKSIEVFEDLAGII